MKTPKILKSIRYTSRLSLFGVPLLTVASGPDPVRDERFGHARGIMAVGDVATGVIAVGGVARGLFANGGVSIGVISSGGVAVGGLASGGIAIGAVAIGAIAIGAIAAGGLAIGLAKAFGGRAISSHQSFPGMVVRQALADHRSFERDRGCHRRGGGKARSQARVGRAIGG
jgi:hypothetical protein